MQQCQDRLEFQIETPNDKELARRFADRQREISELNSEMSTYHKQQRAKKEKSVRAKAWHLLKDKIPKGLSVLY